MSAMLDKNMFPHLFDTVFEAAEDDALLLLRATSRENHTRANEILNTRPLVWTAKGIFHQAIAPGKCPVRRALRRRHADPLMGNAPLQLRRPLPEAVWGLLSPLATPSSVTPTITHIELLDIWPLTVTNDTRMRLTIPTGMVRIWDGKYSTTMDSNHRGKVEADYNTLVYLPWSGAGCRAYSNLPLVGCSGPKPKIVVHVGKNGQLINLNDFDEIHPDGLRELVLIAESPTSPREWVRLTAKALAMLCSVHTEAVTLVNFERREGFKVDEELLHDSWPRGAQTVADIIKAEAGSRSQNMLRFVTPEEYAAEIGKKQFEAEMGL